MHGARGLWKASCFKMLSMEGFNWAELTTIGKDEEKQHSNFNSWWLRTVTQLVQHITLVVKELKRPAMVGWEDRWLAGGMMRKRCSVCAKKEESRLLSEARCEMKKNGKRKLRVAPREGLVNLLLKWAGSEEGMSIWAAVLQKRWSADVLRLFGCNLTNKSASVEALHFPQIWYSCLVSW